MDIIDLWEEIKRNSIKLNMGSIKILPQDIKRYDEIVAEEIRER